MKEFLVHSVFFGAAVSLIGYEAGLLLKRKFKMTEGRVLHPAPKYQEMEW